MATVTVFTSERTAEIEATSIVSGEINAAGHLVLTRHDGTPIDMGAVSGVQLDQGTTYAKADVFSYVGDTDPGSVPDGSVWFDTTGPAGPFASTTQQGLVELATSAETIAGTDTQRAVTPAGLAAVPGNKVQILSANANTETATPSAYPLGISQMVLTTGSGWSINSGFGSVVTYRPETDRTVQHAYSNPGGSGTPRMWQRQYHSSNNGGGWTAWVQAQTLYTLNPANFAQTTNAFSGYPIGWSRLYYTPANSSNWDFAGNYGEVMTYVEGSDFAKQTWTLHASGSAGPAEMWLRTANAGSGWSAWRKFITDPGPWVSWTPTWTTTSGANTPSFGNATVDCKYTKIGRTVHFRMNIQFGSTTNFGGGGSADNWLFTLPVAAPSSGVPVGFSSYFVGSLTKANAGLAQLNSTTQISLYTGSGSVDNAAMNGGIVDSASPFVWASGDRLVVIGTYESAS